MLTLFLMWLIAAVAIIVVAYLLPGVSVSGFGSALIVAVVLGVVNAVLKPILLFLTLPINILTLGLFTLVINALLVMLVAAIVPGFQVRNFWWALLFSILVTILVSIFGAIA